MRSQLDHTGKIPTPTSLGSAHARLSQLEIELAKVAHQLEDRLRERLYASARDYADWRQRAKTAHACLTEEARQLREWIAAMDNRPAATEEDYAAFWRQS